jgi:hypothetical protein
MQLFKKFPVILFAVALAFMLASPLAHAQLTPRNVTVLTLSASTVGTSTTTAITSQAFSIKPGSGFAIVPNFVLSGSDTANITFNFAVSIDGTTWTTVTPFTYTVAATGATPVIGFYNFPAGVSGGGADNILYARLATVQNASSSRTLTINSITVTRDN